MKTIIRYSEDGMKYDPLNRVSYLHPAFSSLIISKITDDMSPRLTFSMGMLFCSLMRVYQTYDEFHRGVEVLVSNMDAAYRWSDYFKEHFGSDEEDFRFEHLKRINEDYINKLYPIVVEEISK